MQSLIVTIPLSLLLSTVVCHEQGHHHHSPVITQEHSHGDEGSALLGLNEHLEALHDHDLDHSHHQEKAEHLETTTNHTEEKAVRSTLEIWSYSLASVLGISLAPCTLLIFIPPQHTNGPFLKILLAFGAGGLLGDALLHIIPHAISHGAHDEHNHDHEHDHNNSKKHADHDHSEHLHVGICVIAGILVFMMVEQLVRIVKGGHCHSHENGHIVADEHRHLNEHQDHDCHVQKKQEADGLKNIKASAYLNLVADFVHNMTDGLAIGASFAAGNTIGWITTLTVLLHELPHEVGDFAILVQSGFSKYQAIRMQAVTALGAITGCIFSLLVSNPGSLNSNTSAIMPFTAGGFIYIATVSVIPELLESGEHNNLSKVAKIGQSLVHVAVICLGVGMMYIVSLVE